MKKDIGVIVGATTFALFMGEAIIHYNMGVSKTEPNHRFSLPDRKDLTRLAVVVGFFSLLNGAIIDEVKKTI